MQPAQLSLPLNPASSDGGAADTPPIPPPLPAPAIGEAITVPAGLIAKAAPTTPTEVPGERH